MIILLRYIISNKICPFFMIVTSLLCPQEFPVPGSAQTNSSFSGCPFHICSFLRTAGKVLNHSQHSLAYCKENLECVNCLLGEAFNGEYGLVCTVCTRDPQESRQHGGPVQELLHLSVGPSTKMQIINGRLIIYITNPQYSHEIVPAKIHLSSKIILVQHSAVYSSFRNRKVQKNTARFIAEFP